MANFVSSKYFLFRNLGKTSIISRNCSTKKIYELRTYSLKPECVKPFMNLTFEKFHIRTNASKLNGYWTAEIGGINQVVHIWEYGKILYRFVTLLYVLYRLLSSYLIMLK